jgi:hypothetical protein
MANRLAIHSVGASLAKYLSDAYPAALRVQHPCQFRLLSSGQMTTPDDDGAVLSLFLYRVTMNEYLRNGLNFRSHRTTRAAHYSGTYFKLTSSSLLVLSLCMFLVCLIILRRRIA